MNSGKESLCSVPFRRIMMANLYYVLIGSCTISCPVSPPFVSGDGGGEDSGEIQFSSPEFRLYCACSLPGRQAFIMKLTDIRIANNSNRCWQYKSQDCSLMTTLHQILR